MGLNKVIFMQYRIGVYYLIKLHETLFIVLANIILMTGVFDLNFFSLPVTLLNAEEIKLNEYQPYAQKCSRI